MLGDSYRVCCFAGPGLSADQQRQIVAEAEAAVGRKHSLVPVVAGVVKSASWDLSGDIFVTLFPACSAHAHEAGSCCQQVGLCLGVCHTSWGHIKLCVAVWN